MASLWPTQPRLTAPFIQHWSSVGVCTVWESSHVSRGFHKDIQLSSRHHTDSLAQPCVSRGIGTAIVGRWNGSAGSWGEEVLCRTGKQELRCCSWSSLRLKPKSRVHVETTPPQPLRLTPLVPCLDFNYLKRFRFYSIFLIIFLINAFILDLSVKIRV